MNWTIIISSIGGSAVLFGTLAFLTRSIIIHLLNKDVENFKSALQLKVVEHQIRFESLHTKRAEVIATFYQKLVVADAALIVLKNSAGQDFLKVNKDSANNALTACIEAFQFFQFHELYFDQHFCGKIKKFQLAIFGKTLLYEGLSNMWKEMLVEHTDMLENRKKWIEDALVSSWKTFTDEVPLLLNELKDHFREILGVSLITKSKNFPAASADRELIKATNQPTENK